jgi:hypothetical protein
MSTQQQPRTETLIRSVMKCVPRPQAVLLCAGVFLAVGLAASCTGTRVPEATVKMQSTSPNGKYRCVVKEQLPPAGYASPHVYTFTIRDERTDRDLKGESYQRDTDSVSLTDLKFAWADDELTVILPTVPPRPYLTVKFNDGEQRWTSVGN